MLYNFDTDNKKLADAALILYALYRSSLHRHLKAWTVKRELHLESVECFLTASVIMQKTKTLHLLE